MSMTNNIANFFKDAEKHVVAIGDLTVIADMQMRTQMDIEHIEHLKEQGIEQIIDENPLKVVWVEVNGDDIWYIVDGFHRMHAAIAEGLDAVSVDIKKGTYNDAIQYAMSANFRGNLTPNDGDCARAIGRLMSVAPDFGYDSKQVVKWLVSFGIKKTVATDYTVAKRKQIDELRDAKIEDLHNEGLSQQKIADELGISRQPVRDLINGLNDRGGQKTQEDDEEDDIFDDVSEESVRKAKERAEAFSRQVAEQEEARKQLKDTVVPNVTTSENVTTVKLTALIRGHKDEATAPLIAAMKKFLEENGA